MNIGAVTSSVGGGIAPRDPAGSPVDVGSRRPGAATDALLPLTGIRGVSAGSTENRLTRDLPSGNRAGPDRLSVEGLTEQERREVRELAARDREVRAHEQAHASVGGRYAGSPTYSYQRGPDGRQYAVGGEVPIDVSPVPGDPEATIDKARVVRRAALAPAQPSPQDRAVATEASAIEQQARAELQTEKAEERAQTLDNGNARGDSAILRSYRPVDVRV